MFAGGPWRGRRYFLDKMSFGEPMRAYATHPAIQCYADLSILGIWLTVAWGGHPLPFGWAIGGPAAPRN
jgi:hypothetical protein